MGVGSKLRKAAPGIVNSWLLFVTLGVLAVVFLVYQFVYVKSNEEELIAKRFRVLAQIGDNIVKREKGFENIAKNTLKKIIIKKGYDDNIKSAALPRLYILAIEHLKERNKILKCGLESLISEPHIIIYSPPGQPADKDKYVFYMNVKDFFLPLHRSDVFDHMAVFEKDTPLYHDFDSTLEIPNLENLLGPDTPIRSGSLLDVTISNSPFKLFLQPINLDDGQKWNIGGLVDRKIFTREARAFKADIVTVFLILFCIFLFGLPLLKLFLMSGFDRLDTGDVILVAFSFVAGTLLVILLHLYSHQYIHDNRQLRTDLQAVAEKIHDEFTLELEQAYNELDRYDNINLKQHGLLPDETYKNILSQTEIQKEYSNRSQRFSFPLSNQLQPVEYKRFKVVFWADEKGEQKLELVTRKFFGGLVNIGHRGYFRNASIWEHPTLDGKRFMLESIISSTSGEKLAVISKISTQKLSSPEIELSPLRVAAMTSQLTSVIDTVMPAGFGFCITDRNGNVWFHSDKRRNKEENFFNEVQRDPELIAAVKSRRARHVHLYYQNKSHICYVAPVRRMPLFIVTFRDMDYPDTMQTHIVFYALFFTFLLLLFNGMLPLIPSCGKLHWEQGSSRRFNIHWLRPFSNSAALYSRFTLANAGLMLLLILFKLPSTPSGTLFLCLSASLWAMGNYLETVAQKNLLPIWLTRRWRIGLFAFFIVVIHLGAFFYTGYLLPLVIFQVLAALVIYLTRRYAYKNTFKEESDNTGEAKNYYPRFLFSWLLLVCAVPLVMFFIDAYNYENELTIKHFQFKLARQVEARNFHVNTFYREQMLDPNENPAVKNSMDARKTSGIYADPILETRWHIIPTSDFRGFAPPEKFSRLLYSIRANLGSLDLEKRNLVFTCASDNSRHWESQKDRLVLKYQSGHAQPDLNPGPLPVYTVDSKLKHFPFPIRFITILTLIVLLALLFLIYRLLCFTLRRVFGIQLLKPHQPIDFPTCVEEFLQGNSSLIIYCQHHRQIRDFNDSVGKHFQSTPVDLLEHTADNLPEIQDFHKPVFIKNFQLIPHDYPANLNQLKILSALLDIPGLQLVVPTMTPLDKTIHHYNELPGNDENNTHCLEALRLLGQIRQILVPMFYPLKSGKTQPFPYIQKIEEQDIKELLINEFSVSPYFKEIEKNIYHYYRELKKQQLPGIKENIKQNIKAKLIQRIRELAHHFYHQLLNSCTPSETFVLLDIADDQLVNPNNLGTIKILLQKGLLVYDKTFQVMNRSFRDFILHAVDSSEVKQMVGTLTRRGKWKRYKVPLSILVLGIVIFLAFQDNILSEINALVTAVIGSLALLSNFSGALSKFRGSSG